MARYILTSLAALAAVSALALIPDPAVDAGHSFCLLLQEVHA